MIKLSCHKPIIAGATLAGLLLSLNLIVQHAGAHEGAKGIVKQRMKAMSDLGYATKSMLNMFKGHRKYDPATLARLAKAIADHAGALPAMFPEGSGGHPSETSPSAWTDRQGFLHAFGALMNEATKLSRIAPTATKNEAMAQFFKMSRTCTACHTYYRKAKKNPSLSERFVVKARDALLSAEVLTTSMFCPTVG